MIQNARIGIVAWLDRTSARWWPDERADSNSGGSPLEITKLIGIAFKLAVIAAVVQGCIHYFDALVLDFRISMFNADDDGGVFTWASSMATAMAGLGVLLVASQVKARSRVLILLSMGLFFFSLDDAVALHERIPSLPFIPVGHSGRIVWIVCAMPLLAAVFVGLLAFAWRAPEALRKAVIWGLGGLVIAIFLEFTSPVLFTLGSDHGKWLYELEVVAEEGLELASWILIGAATSISALWFAQARARDL
jgi:hypothetical protein